MESIDSECSACGKLSTDVASRDIDLRFAIDCKLRQRYRPCRRSETSFPDLQM